MNKYKINYYFDHGFVVSQIVESDSRESVIKGLIQEGMIDFTDADNIYHLFNMKDIKLINVMEVELEPA
ncbi:hypothetical protein WQ54_09605 [Bacillus sp. SA1-12]|uniref:hypothetical protein n=1 Tax=Bacillus sp. SA1-12 TaxID=1455638 RepID=UPI0006258254|nr:hypothetical protein [Bacillus sp. SA1-12]KKI92416.1 hypothetical protein WQ54_09605 [Bacillus sp. SA1-12]